MNAFLTGSTVYGIPNENSDVDLVILTDKETMKTLANLQDAGSNQPRYSGTGEGHTSASIRFGKLNLIVVTNYDEYEAWRLATKALCKEKPVTKDRAIAQHEWLRAGIKS